VSPEIREGSLAEILRRRLLISGQDQAPNELLAELIGVLALEVDRPEWGYLKGERLCWGTGEIASVANERQQVSLFNPNESVLAVVHEIFMTENVTSTEVPIIRSFDAALGTASTLTGLRERRWDRFNPFGRPECRIGQLSSATVFGTAMTRLRLAMHLAETGPAIFRTAWEYHWPIVLPGQTGINVTAQADARKVECTFVWTERQILPFERPSP